MLFHWLLQGLREKNGPAPWNLFHFRQHFRSCDIEAFDAASVNVLCTDASFPLKAWLWICEETQGGEKKKRSRFSGNPGANC